MFKRFTNAVRSAIGRPSVYTAFGATITIHSANFVEIEYNGEIINMKTSFIAAFGDSEIINNKFRRFVVYGGYCVNTAEPFILKNGGRFYDLYLNPIMATPMDIDQLILGHANSLIVDKPGRIKYAQVSRTAYVLDYSPDRLLSGCEHQYLGKKFIDEDYGKVVDFNVYYTPLYVVGNLYEFDQFAHILKPPTFDNCRSYVSIESNESVYKCGDTYFCLVVYNDDPARMPSAFELEKISGKRTKPAIRAVEHVDMF